MKNIPPSTAAHTMKPTGADDFAPSAVNGVARTTSTFTTESTQDSIANSTAIGVGAGMGGNAWGSYNGSNTEGFGESPTMGGGFGEPIPSRSQRAQQPSMAASVAVPKGTGELVVITILPDKEGMFLFQHHNYEVKTIRRGSTVVRRFSDFVWLLDCLQKRYPFRRLPLLPPKRIQGKCAHEAQEPS